MANAGGASLTKSGSSASAGTKGPSTVTIKATLTPSAVRSLASAGLTGEERGGDAKFSTTGRKVGRTGMQRTSKVVIVTRKDGKPMSSTDSQAARSALSAS